MHAAENREGLDPRKVKINLTAGPYKNIFCPMAAQSTHRPRHVWVFSLLKIGVPAHSAHHEKIGNTTGQDENQILAPGPLLARNQGLILVQLSVAASASHSQDR
ncbi:hypothetical protein MAPG_01308 [Magnaporthiopsis poae ATCC 64411]|uniref:Uncharacterized protein n=1 Tax=Magnaporthiopsis poae (strain ATCC 64411 / 73-15) TaxID=644358 RepID=A0A0C4DNC7_MAGP6|nr:hypothetical protein MAPG_01308 [Magnaporthiopsis poae ATCC 64411]